MTLKKMVPVANLIKFAKEIGKLKRVKRTGWINHKVPNPESVAEHSFRTALLAMVLAPYFNVNQDKVTEMALIHDLAEAEVGDIVIEEGNKMISDTEDKKSNEFKAIKKIFSIIIADEELIELYHEFDDDKTPESKFVKQLDKLEMAIQAAEYEEIYNLDLKVFFENVQPKLNDSYLKEILLTLLQSRSTK